MASRLPEYFELDRFGITPESVVQTNLHCDPEQIQRNVILMPSWEPGVFAEVAGQIAEIAPDVWEIEYLRRRVSLVRCGMGAPMAGEAVLALSCTPCENLVFTGSVAALEKSAKIGDLFIIERSICGDGFSRYLSPDPVPRDCLEEPVEPNTFIRECLRQQAQGICDANSVPLHEGVVFSMDCVLPEYFRIGHYADRLGCKGVEMATAAVFRAARLVQIRAAALLIVSDIPLQEKSLYAGRTENDRSRRRWVTRQVLAPALLDSLVSL